MGGQATVAVRVVYAGTAAYAALFVFAAVVHYLVFKTPRGDLGNMVQAIWNTLHGHFLEATSQHGQLMSRFRGHVDPFLLVFVPLLWIWSSPLLLPVVQALAVASGALPVFWLARKHLGSPRAGAHFAFAYLLYPATQFNAFTVADSFHPVAIAVPLVLYAIWFLDEDRLVAFSVVALLAFTTKEEIPLAVGCLGIWYAVRKGRRMFGLGVFAVGLARHTVQLPVASSRTSRPAASTRSSADTARSAARLGEWRTSSSPIPSPSSTRLRTAIRARISRLLLVPFLGLSLFEPLLLLGAVPDLAINLLSSAGGQTSIGFETDSGHRAVRRRGGNLRCGAIPPSCGGPFPWGACGNRGGRDPQSALRPRQRLRARSARRWWPRRRTRSALFRQVCGLRVESARRPSVRAALHHYVPAGLEGAVDRGRQQRPDLRAPPPCFLQARGTDL